MTGNEQGFTFIEIIAVLLILGIISVVAVQRYQNVANQARRTAAQGAIAEIKGRLSSAQAKYMLVNRIVPTSLQLYDYAIGSNAYRSAANLRDVGTSFTLTLTRATPITITVSRVRNIVLTPSVLGTFRAAGG
jgi:prepilin-type N-terminal cleavage/methylation domain-containing protein